ncbi:MAG: High-affinity zinc uptake system binding-protein ZnuA [Phycisphaerae bacterium]|nr:High-affinity zinc uptake system binding-protein ZnuA [Phycisphaerae bacterium]
MESMSRSPATRTRVGGPGLALLLAACLAAGAGCRGQADTRPADGRIAVTVSILPQKWIVQRVGGDHVAVAALLSPGDDPHTFAPTDAQITAVMRSRLFLRIGVPFEGGQWARAIAASSRVRVVDMQRGIALRPVAAGDADEPPDAMDPHVWLSPPLLRTMAANTADALAEADPAHAADYRRNLAAVEAELDALDRDLHTLLDPLRGRAFIVFHPAWAYFAAEFGLTQVAIEVEGKAPSDSELTVIRRRARESGVKVVFVQPQVSGAAAAAVARAIGGRTATLDPLAEDVAANLRAAAGSIAAAMAEEGGRP